jgi:hypothetical protein
MKSNKEFNIEEIRNKISKGLDLTFTKLVKEKALYDRELVFSDKGKIYTVKAKDLLKE